MLERKEIELYPESDAELAKMAQDGDMVAATLLWQMHRKKIEGWLTTHKKRAEWCGGTVEDLKQLSWFVLLDMVKKWDGKREFGSYIKWCASYIATLAFPMHQHKGKLVPIVSGDDLNSEGEPFCLFWEGPDDTEEEVERRELARIVAKSVNSLNETCRKETISKYYLGIPPKKGTGSAAAWRAKKYLAEMPEMQEAWKALADLPSTAVYKTSLRRFVNRRGSSVELIVEKMDKRERQSCTAPKSSR